MPIALYLTAHVFLYIHFRPVTSVCILFAVKQGPLSSDGYAQYETYCEEIRYHGAAPGTDKGKGYPCHRQNTYAHAHVFNKVKTQHPCQANHQKGPELVPGINSDVNASHQQYGYHQHHYNRSYKAQLLSYHRKNEVGVVDRHPVALRLYALIKAFSEKPSRADGQF